MPWTDKVACEVFRRAGVWKGLMHDMIVRQMTFLGNVIRTGKSSANWICTKNTWSTKTERNVLDVSQQKQGYKT